MALIRYALESLIGSTRGQQTRILDESLESVDQETIEVAQDFLDLILEHRVQCLSQVQYHTGYSLPQLRDARDLLEERHLIEPIRGCMGDALDKEYKAYRLAS